ncbi:DoxX family protein [Streptomyces sp. JJ36]|uniref:DoxX family protein n=1 Tax=Streptomyces sp. JJ36 TaxID=2736645 RepID=UPI001F34DFB9|nr:DoxX family protein [Streptomyces sp. JJ36]MCF6525791.1 DoxX family protein [Streptomyces sp. JJ36]
MFIAYVVLAVLLSVLLVVSGRAKLVRDQDITETLTRLGVPQRLFPVLAALEFAGALGLLAGILYRPLGIAAGIGVVLYFAGAVVSHLRAKDFKGAPVPSVLVLVSAAPLVLGLATV